uniref:Spliceosome associated factor 3, U4/U6 recycling protein n=1 Tax=Hippocampus comes TaxID=109280 RepID=A0A3Q2YTI2_HIPCM
MAAASNAEHTHLQDMEEDDAEMDDRQMDSESDGEEGMGVDNSDDEEDETSEDEKENEAEIQRLEEQLSINAFDYNCHVDLIKLLKHEGELIRLRKARQKMSELFPLTEEIWLDWLKDEIRMTEEEPNREKVNELFEKAIKDYICPDIWLEYAQYSIGGMGSPGGIERVRSVFERAITAVGLHMTKGQTVWEAYREFENAILATLVAETPKLAEYQAYIDFEMKEGDPARIQMTFERTLIDNCLVPDMWTKYATYLDRQLKIKDLVLSTHDRAVRNCPWTMSLWKSYLQAIERHGGTHQTVSDLFEKALNAGFIQATDYVAIWQVYLDYLRRRVDFSQESSQELEELRGSFTRCLDYMKQDVEERFGESGDPSCNIMQIWARIEALHCKNMQKARELWDSIMTKGNAKYANMWLEYYNLERAYGDSLHCRKALHRAVQCTSDYPEHVCEVLLTFERVQGSLEDWDVAVLKTETRLNRVNEQRAKVAEKEAIQALQEEEQFEQKRKAKAEKRAQKKVQKGGRFGEKRKADKEEDILTLEIDLHEKAPPGYKGSARPGFNKAQQASAQQQSDDKTELRNDDSSVFVSNLSYTLDEPEARLRTLFETCGTVKQIRLVSTNKGTFKGYGYVQFESSESVSEALKLDRQQVEGRPMFVSPCVDKNKNPDFKMFKYNTAMEKHKIFISGLPFSCTKEQLEELSKNHGTLKEVRLVTFRSGKPKGLAYVEFADEAQASQAVLKMDGMYVEGNKISVAISNPPRRNTSKPGPSLPTTNPTPHQVHGSRGRGRTQLSLLPRSLNRQSGSASKVENGTASDEGAGDAKPLSNADFAKMLLKK